MVVYSFFRNSAAAIPLSRGRRLLEGAMKLCLLIVGALAASHAFSTPESAAAMTTAPAEKTFEALAFVPNATAIGLGFVESALTQARAHLALQAGNLLSFNVTAFKDAWCSSSVDPVGDRDRTPCRARRPRHSRLGASRLG